MGAADRPWTADRRILRLLQYWRDGRPGPGLLPGRQAIDPIVLGPDLLPLMALVEPIDDGRRFRFRLVGTELARNAGLDLTGRYVDERSEEHTSELQSLMRLSYAVFCLKKKNNTNTNTHTLPTRLTQQH